MKLKLDSCVYFSWSFGPIYLLQSGPVDQNGQPTGQCWLWSSPTFRGDNSIKKVRKEDVPNILWRRLGWGQITEVCGTEVKFRVNNE